MAGLLGILLLAVVLLLLSLDDFLALEPPETVAVREIQLYTPPPPPPPPPVNRENANTTNQADLPMANIRADVELDMMPVDFALRAGVPGTGTGFGGEILVDYGSVELGELDGYPTPVNSPTFNFPREAIQRNVTAIDLTLHIIIDEQGNAYLVDILQSSYPVSRREVDRFVSLMKFTPPTLLGTPVRTEFSWPVHIERSQ